MLLRVPSLIEFGSHCLQTSGCTGGFIEFSMKCCSPNAVKGKQPTSEEPCVTGSSYPEMECLLHSVHAPNSSTGQTREALTITPDALPTTPKLGIRSQPLASFPLWSLPVRKPWRLHPKQSLQVYSPLHPTCPSSKSCCAAVGVSSLQVLPCLPQSLNQSLSADAT